MENILRATERLIDSVWTLEYIQIDSKSIRIISLTHDNPIGYEQERELPRMSLIEDGSRIVLGAIISPYEPFKCWAKDGDEFTVVNPQYVFSYSNANG